ncbi:MAG: pseudouridine synthase [Pseudomonadota bacterium]
MVPHCAQPPTTSDSDTPVLILFNKPFRVLSQFTTDSDKATLAAFIDQPGVYPAGRLDYDSEGLLLLTDDGQLQSRISAPRFHLPKRYWVQVEGEVSDTACERLRNGVDLKDGAARALSATRIPEPAALWQRDPPIRVRKSVPDSWMEVVIDEGRNRQVRRMTAAVGLPCLRLIRHQVGPWQLKQLQPGAHQSIESELAWRQLKTATR